MPPVAIFNIHLVLGYVACLLAFGTYIFPKLRSMDRFSAHRVIATIHSFRFFGLVFILPGVVGNLPAGFAPFCAGATLPPASWPSRRFSASGSVRSSGHSSLPSTSWA